RGSNPLGDASEINWLARRSKSLIDSYGNNTEKVSLDAWGSWWMAGGVGRWGRPTLALHQRVGGSRKFSKFFESNTTRAPSPQHDADWNTGFRSGIGGAAPRSLSLGTSATPRLHVRLIT